MSNKSTKRALLTSIMALFLCFTMLLGTTYAWFTDSVSSANNIIKSGNLDIGVYYAYPSDIVDGDIPADAWKPVTDEKSIFNNDALWEPGYTEAVFLKFVNEGTLALQYQMKIDILKEVIGKNEADEDIQLSKYINAYACNCFSWDYKDYLFAEREDAISPEGAPTPYYDTLYNAANGDVATPNGDNPLSLDSWQWLEPAETTYATVVLWMPTTVGNEANYKKSEDAADPEKYAPHIDLGVTVLATQYAYEQDSFGNQYDKDAKYEENVTYVYSADEAFIAFNSFDQSGKSGIVSLSANYKTADSQSHWSSNREYALRAEGTDVVFNMNGKKVTHDTSYQNGSNTGYTYLFTTAYNGKLTVDGAGSVYSKNENGHTCIFYAQGPSEIVINDGDYHAVSGVSVWAGKGATVTINGGTFTSSEGDNDQEMIYSSGGVINIYGGFFHSDWEDRPVNVADRNRDTGYIYIYGGTFVNFDPSTGGNDPSNIIVMEGYKVVSETQANGDVWYTVVPK